MDKERLPRILEGWHPSDVYNCDETGLIFRMLPNKTIASKGADCHGNKNSKDRMTLIFCANADGTEKYELAMIGKYQNPRCFKNVSHLPVMYYAQQNAWMDKEIYKKWLQQLDKTMTKEGRYFCSWTMCPPTFQIFR